MEISFVKFDPRAPLVGLRANTGAWFETETSPSHLSFVRGGALELRGPCRVITGDAPFWLG